METLIYYVYLIESQISGIWYVGLSADPERRLKEHNQGKSKFTKGHRPWKLLFVEKVGDLQSARKREKYYKTAAGKRRLKAILSQSKKS